MPMDYLPTTDRELLAWLKNFITVATANKAVLGLTDADLAELTSATTSFDTKLTAHDAAHQAAKAATEDKNTSQKSATTQARTRAQRIQTHAGVPKSLLDQLGLTVRDTTRSAGTAETPQELIATPGADGTNTLKWKSGGNKPGIQYQIEARAGEGGTWALIDSTTRTSYAHTGQIPGQKVRYRVRAKRGDKTSGYSNEAGVYGG